MSARDEACRQAGRRLETREALRAENLEQLANLDGEDKDFVPVDSVERVAVRAESLGFAQDAADLRAGIDDTAVKRVFEKILGANDLLDASFLFRGAEVARSVGRITIPVPGGRRLGTGFMISPRVMMTNNHVIEDRTQAGVARLEFDFFDRGDGETGPVIRFALQPQLLFITDAALDFTVVAVQAVNAQGDAVADRGSLPLIGPSGKAVIGERVSIIQHPNGDPQKVVVHDNKVTDVDPDDDFLHYQADTMGGSSGSPVFNINWDVAALHHAAVRNDNEGIRISSIVRHLNQLFSNESSETGDQRRLLSEVLAPTLTRGEKRSPGSQPAPQANQQVGPQQNADGTVSWTVPVHITLGVGDQPTEQPVVTSDPAPTTVSMAVQSDSALQDALDALEQTAGRTYYSEAKDAIARQEYYPKLDRLKPAKLYEVLSDLLVATHTTTLSYSVARKQHLYPWIDRREGPDRLLKGIYTNQEFSAAEVIRQDVQAERFRAEALERLRLESTGPDQMEAFLEELEAQHPFNCEHVVPQSWFAKRKQPKTDLHHLFTCEWSCNSFRGNRAYFEFEAEAVRDGCGELDDAKFEPAAGKGAVARATLYFLVRYPGDVADTSKEMPMDRLATLVRWANNDKVDRWELHRNAEIAKVQGNRNPFIDFPKLVDKVDFTQGWA